MSDLDVGQLAFDTGGVGPPALFVHGFGASKFTWRHVSRGVADIFSYYAIDLPGSGDSPTPKNFAYSIGNVSAALTDFILRKNFRELTLIGHSLGVAVALLALLDGDASFVARVKSICIVDGIAYSQDFPFFMRLLRIPLVGDLISEVIPPVLQVKAVLRFCYFNQRLVANDQVEEYSRYLRRPAVRAALKQTARLIDRDQLSSYSARLNTIQIPALLIWGAADRVVPLAHGQRLQREFANANLVVIDRCGHIPQEECPDRVIAALRTFDHQLRIAGARLC